MILEGAYGSFCCVDSVLFRWDTLKSNLILLKRILQVLRAFVIKDVELWWMSVADQCLVSGLPGVSDACCLAVGYGHGVDGVCVLMIQHENIVITAAGGNGETSGLVGVRLENCLFFEQHGTELMRAWFEGGCYVNIGSL